MELSKKKSVKSFVPFIILIAAIILPLLFNNRYVLTVGYTVLMYIYFACCWNLIGGLAGQFALGNGLYIGVGAYAAGICMEYDISPFLAFPIGIVVSVVLAFLISSLCFRLSGTYFSLSTVAFLYITRYLIVGNNFLFGLRTNAGMGITIKWRGGLQWLQFKNKAIYYWIFLALVVIVVLITRWIQTHKMGYYLTAIKTNQGAAATIGIPVRRYKMYAQCLSAALMSIGGVLYACIVMNVDPYFVLGYDLSLQIMMFVVIGGLGTLWGPVVGAGLLMLFKEIVRVNIGPDYAQLALVAFGVMLILCIMFAPKGIVGLAEQLFDKIKGKIAAGKNETKKEEA